MEQFFASLSKRQTMLLLTSLAFGGSQAVEAYQHLTEHEEELLRHRAQGLLQIARDKRIPLLVQEIKRLVMARRRQFSNADPQRLAAVLAKERPALVDVVLVALPVELADAVRAVLGPRKASTLRREVKPDVLSIIRWKLEEALRSGAPQLGLFRFTDLLTLQQREVLTVCDRMGARVLATAIAGLPDPDREALLSKLPPDQRVLAARAAEAGRSKRLSPEDANTVLGMHRALEDPSMGMRSAGAQRVARACLAQSPEFAARMVERHPGALGKLLVYWIREERPKPIKGDGGRMDIVEQLERLAQKGVVDRPMRLPPPIRGAGLTAGGPAVAASGPVEPRPSVPLKALASIPRHPSVSLQAQKPPRRDSLAQGEVKKAGVSGELPTDQARIAQKPPLRVLDRQPTDPRIIRDGKPLVREPTPPLRKPTNSAPAQPAQGRSHHESGLRSPVLKGGRGPSGGSR